MYVSFCKTISLLSLPNLYLFVLMCLGLQQYIYTRRYQLFRVAFIVYLLAPTAILLIQGALFSWEQDWVVFTLNEMIVLLMFFHVGVNFSPIHEHLASRAFDGTYTPVHVD